MTEDTPPESPNRGQLMEEAALWFARMRGPEAETHRAEFDAWLARGALHRSAYNRAGEIFSLGKFLREDSDSTSDDRPIGEDEESAQQEHDSRKWRLLPIAVLAVCVLMIIGWAVLARPYGGMFGVRDDMASHPAAEQLASYAARPGEVRVERLPDGSVVTLQPGSMLTVAFSANRRDLRLVRGTGRFEVAHEARPFVVAAGGGTVTARGTVFEVRLAADSRVTVRLVRGSIDVLLPRTGQTAPLPKRLAPGQTISFGANAANAGNEAPPASAPSPVSLPPKAAMRAFDRVRLADVVAQANAGSPVQILLADPALGDRMVSGQFRISDPEKLAEKLAWIFDLRVDRHASGEIILSER